MSTPTYDPSIIHKHAADLYSRASGVVFTWSIFIGALALGAAMFYLFPKYPPGHTARMWTIFFGIVGLIIGHNIGSARAFRLRLEAQVALCQAAIEFNTRKGPHEAAPVPVDHEVSGVS